MSEIHQKSWSGGNGSALRAVTTMTLLLKCLWLDLLKTKARTIYVKNELAKKVNKSTLSDYVLKSDLNTAISDLNNPGRGCSVAVSLPS